MQLNFQKAIAAQPLWLQFVEMIAVVDLATYWIHRAFHQLPWLWRFHAVFIHANLRWRFPGLHRAISTPQYHHWHHATDADGIDKNFAQFLPVWDVLFGTVHLPQGWPKHYWVAHFQPPETYLGQLVYPFRSPGSTPPQD
ncbi:sterol desaturase family protein [Actimicrobium sp. CCC2.4]|uniref:sterol desaturase family protein n=1 Tax=Actimicrobium sp. CCC2.4 TaxID=3048606 RepID=UPI002AC90A0F|nr:sterol desaturase family protein [Actimicrobium sp. CCC2.4]MEB0134718.1 sterol desaturase family protein [Actimicrobium sp. CCC2.4]WPX30660.1 sterol desaturase family protein [Actimicrobium sp. CCC2.4]